MQLAFSFNEEHTGSKEDWQNLRAACELLQAYITAQVGEDLAAPLSVTQGDAPSMFYTLFSNHFCRVRDVDNHELGSMD
jgi:hypothetical protein